MKGTVGGSGVEQREQHVVLDRIGPRPFGRPRRLADTRMPTTCRSAFDQWAGHLVSVRIEPDQVAVPVVPAAVEVAPPPQHLVRVPDRDDVLRELEQRRLLGRVCPVQPADVVVLTVGVVVAVLRARRLSSPARIIGTPCDSSSVARKLRICRTRASTIAAIVGRPFDPEVGAQVVRLAVLVALLVGLVVLALVAHEIAQREAVVTRHVVDARERLASRRLIEIAAAGDAASRTRRSGRDRRARTGGWCRVACVPLRPARAESGRPGSRARRDPTARRSASRRRGSGPDGPRRRTTPSGSKAFVSRASAVARSKRKPSTCISVTQ